LKVLDGTQAHILIFNHTHTHLTRTTYNYLTFCIITTNMSVMCKATTLRGTPCNCKAKTDSDYCGRHKNVFECSICYTTSTDKKIIKCGHEFCHKCIDTWTKTNNTCPICRAPITEQIPDSPKYPTRIIDIRRELIVAEAIIQQYRMTARLPSYYPFQ